MILKTDFANGLLTFVKLKIENKEVIKNLKDFENNASDFKEFNLKGSNELYWCNSVGESFYLGEIIESANELEELLLKR